MINKQSPEKPRKPSKTLEVNEIFFSLQGEGPFVGWPAVFIRLAGCNLRCPKCDTAYTDPRRELTIPEILNLIRMAWVDEALHQPIVVITGGEPFRQDIGGLVAALFTAGYRVQIETNGSLRPSAGFPYDECSIVCSPKGPVNPIVAARAVAYKYVGAADDLSPTDGLPLRGLNGQTPDRPFDDKPVFLQPMDEKDIKKNQANQAAVVASCLKYGHILCLQLHKIIGKE